MTVTGENAVDVARPDTVDAVRNLIVEALGLWGTRADIDADTELFGSLPELDSLAIVQVVTEIEDRFGFEFSEEDITGDVFETVGSLAAYVDRQSP
jgi:acyl carrier protein